MRAITLTLLFVFAGCASSSRPDYGSTGAAPTGERLRIVLHDYRPQTTAPNGQFMEILGQAFGTQAEIYSRPVPQGHSTKALEDIALEAIVEHLEDQGFEERSQPGPSPASSQAIFTTTLEIESDAGVRNFTVGRGSAPEDLVLMGTLRKDFMDVFNAIRSYQAFQNPDGGAFFDKQKQSLMQSLPGKKR